MKRSLAIMAVLIILVLAFFYYRRMVYQQRIKEGSIYARVINIVKDNGQLKIYYFENNTGLRLKLAENISIGYDNFIYSDTFHITDVQVGDSLVKAPNDLQLTIYRKDAAGQYQPLKEMKAEL